MASIVFGLFLVVHGLVHLLYLAPPPTDDPAYPFVPGDRWLPRRLGLGPGAARTLARAIAILVAAVLAIAGIILLVGGPWETVAVAGSVLSMVLLVAFFHRYLVIGITIDIAIVLDVLVWQVPAAVFEG